ncbi:MAG: aldehyde dehydrogenase [Clostridia bacterium]|nr:aldehyde dehydrogenase [Clostridia bacterium]
MEAEEIKRIVDKQHDYFLTGETLSVKFRLEMLKKLQNIIKKYEDEIAEALKKDLGKSHYESYMCEIGLALAEIRYMIKHTKKFAKEKRVHTPLAQFASKSYQKPTPYGNVLIMSPWNYPFLLSIDPLANAISAGNTIVLKPSAYSPETSFIVEKIIKECFSEEYVAVVTGGRKENASLLENKFDFIFFTGSQNVGKEVLVKASAHLTPVILELGGKSPCIVDSSAKIKLTAKRIVFGKFLNCGQTCVAPDYILCHKSVKDELVKEIIAQIKLQYGEDVLSNENYGKIINQKHFDRINGLINKDKVVYGGNSNPETLQIAPTVMNNVTEEDAVMGEEIFGPILPILEFEKIEDVIDNLSRKPKPLALYVFAQDKKVVDFITERCRYGGGCINDTIIHLATSEMGFGGVGESGMGAYHGKVGFDAFSHYKSIVDKKTWIDLPMRYQPYTSKRNQKLVRFFLK